MPVRNDKQNQAFSTAHNTTGLYTHVSFMTNWQPSHWSNFNYKHLTHCCNVRSKAHNQTHDSFTHDHTINGLHTYLKSSVKRDWYERNKITTW